MSEKCKNVVKLEGVNIKGYGIIQKLVMQDRRLTRDAKAIYAYFRSYAGNGSTAFPSGSKICYDLGFGKYDTYKKHLKLLIQYNYVTVHQERWEEEDPEGKYKKGQFKHNVYTLIDMPDPESTQEEVEKAVPPKEGYPQKAVPAKGVCNNKQFLNNNNFYNYQSVLKEKENEPEEHNNQDIILNDNPRQTENEINQILGFTETYLIEDAKESKAVHKAVSTLYTLKEFIDKSKTYTQNTIREKLQQLNYEIYRYALDKFKMAKEQKEIRNKSAYFEKILFTAIDEYYANAI